MSRVRGSSLVFINADLAKSAQYKVALVIALAIGCNSTYSQAADLPSGSYAYVAPVAIVPSGWQFRVTPYAWAPSVNGDVTVRGHTRRHRFVVLGYSTLVVLARN